MNAYPEFDDEDFDEDLDTSRVTYQARKAAMEDLDFLRGLWRAQGVDPADFEERWPEFHVIIDLQGAPVGAVGFMVEGKNGWLFFEGYDLETAAESAQELAINRVVNLAKSQGLLRVWSHLDSANLESRDFTVATPSQRTFLPVEWDRALAPEPNQRVDWKVVQIRDEAAMQQMEKELALFDAMNQGRRMSDQKPVAGKMMSILAIILAIVIFGIGIYVLFFYANQATTPRS
jgi:hypothetical protein